MRPSASARSKISPSLADWRSYSANVNGGVAGVSQRFDHSRGQAHCRPGTSTSGREGELSLADGSGRVPQRFSDVLGLEVRVGGDDLIGAHPVGDHADNGRDGDRSSRMHGTPPMWSARTVIRVNVMKVTLLAGPDRANPASKRLPNRVPSAAILTRHNLR